MSLCNAPWRWLSIALKPLPIPCMEEGGAVDTCTVQTWLYTYVLAVICAINHSLSGELSVSLQHRLLVSGLHESAYIFDP